MVGLVPTVTNSRLYDVEDGSGFITSTSGLEFLTFGGGSGPSITAVAYPEIATLTNFRWRFQRTTNGVVGTYSLEVWDELTGTYYSNSIVDAAPANVYNLNSKQIGPGSINGFHPAAAANLGALRIDSTVLPLGSTLPQRFLTSSFGNMGDWEFEGVLTDASPLARGITVTGGSTTYLNPTTTFPPVISLNAVPKSVRAAFSAAPSVSGFTNADDPNFTCTLAQTSGSGRAAFTNPGCASFTLPVFGQYDFVTTITDSLSVATSKTFSVGAVATDSNGVVIVSDANINRLLGPLIRLGGNPWSWFDNRAVALAELQVGMLDGSGTGAINPWQNQWDGAAAAGTISCTFGDTFCTGSGTAFQTLFCAGGTTPTANIEIVVRYNSSAYPGTTGRAFYPVGTCDSQTKISFRSPLYWGYASGTQTGLAYSAVDGGVGVNGVGNWVFSNTPGNYYDNVLAFYALYYRSGLTRYRDAARLLAHNFWYGPFYDRGQNYDTASLGGTFIASGPGRGQSQTGLILWSLESGENIWPGMDIVLAYQKSVVYDYGVAHSWVVQVGDLREAGYLTAAEALCTQYHTDGSKRSSCLSQLKTIVNSFWVPLQITGTGHGNWRNTNPLVLNVGNANGLVYVNATNGSNSVVATGTSWVSGQFYAGTVVWLYDNWLDPTIPGKQNSGTGDSAFYVGTYVDPTHITLDRNYTGTTGQHGMIVSQLAGFGTQPFMEGIWGGQAGSIVYDALVNCGVSCATEAAIVKQFSIDSAGWITGNATSADHTIYTGAEFLNCSPLGSDLDNCGPGEVLNAEVMKNYNVAYLHNLDPAIKTAGDNLYTREWCKPTGGWTCGTAGFGSYNLAVDDYPTGYQTNPADPQSNKWNGYNFGYGFGAGWPAARVGGLLPADPLVLTTSGVIPVGGAKIRLMVQAPDGTITIYTCAGTAGTTQACAWTGDRREGNHLLTVAYLTSGDVLISTGQPQAITVQ